MVETQQFLNKDTRSYPRLVLENRAISLALPKLGLSLLLGFILLLMPCASALAQDSPINILILNSYHHGFSWTDNVVLGIQSVLLDPQQNSAAANLEVYIEYMDTKRLPLESDGYQRWYDLLAAKYSDVELDLIIVSDNNAFNFMIEQRDTLFPGVAVVFCGVNFFESSQLAGVEMFTGVTEEADIRENLDIALGLHPDTRKIVVVNDTTITGQIVQQELLSIIPEYQQRVEFELYDNLSLAELEQNLSGLGEDTLVLLILLNRDRDGQFFTYEQSIDLISSYTDRPIYGLWDFYMGRGMVGGRLVNARSQGVEAGKIAVQLLQGKNIMAIPVVDSPNKYIFDSNELERLNLSIRDLPGYTLDWRARDELEVVNAAPTLARRYGLILGVFGAVLLVAVIISLVQWNSLRLRRLSDAALRESYQELEETRDLLEARVNERTYDLTKRSEQLASAAIVARDAADVQDMEQLMHVIVDLISERFEFYHAGIFLIDQLRKFAVLHAASSEGGRQMLMRGHKLRVAEQGIVGFVASRGEPRIASDVGGDAVWFDNPDLPETRSEMGLPLKIGTQVIGVLDVQSTEPQAFTEDDISTLQIMADQLALAIRNVRLFDESQRAYQRLEVLYGEQLRKAWGSQVDRHGYRYNGVDVSKLVELEEPSDPDSPEEEQALVIPIPLGDASIGTIVLDRADKASSWTVEEQTLAQSVGMQTGLALENARLLVETQARAEQERLVSDISSRIRETLDVDSVLQTALREIGRVLDIDDIEVRMGSSPDADD